MPTPFMHLDIAEKIRASDRLSGRFQGYLAEEYSAFYLGSVAPDVQTAANIKRFETHFYHVPPRSEEEGCRLMLESYPQLKDPGSMPLDQAVFIVGYCVHLMLDLQWYHEILIPFFVENSKWDSRRRAFLVHNTLLTYLDKSAVEQLPSNAAEILSSGEPRNWLPFVSDLDLVKWRDQLVDQLKPGAMLQTVEVYAHRMGMSAEEFSANLDESEWMNRHLFSKVPVDQVEEKLQAAVDDGIDLMNDYLAPI